LKKLVFFATLLLCLLSLMVVAGAVDTVFIRSAKMHKDIKCVVIKPDDYDKSNIRYPVVYLLHGHGGNYAQWINLAPQLKKAVDDLHLLIVCPDGGYSSWYFDSPIDSSIRYETYITRDVIAYIDAGYRTLPEKKGRAIAGLSMGGHGALYLSALHPDLFGAAGSMSGGVDIRPFPDKWDIAKVLGDITKFAPYWDEHSAINAMEKLKNNELRLIIDCGVDDFFMEVNRDLHRRLLQRRIDHDFIERPGEHNSAYWNNAVDSQMIFFRKYFDEMNIQKAEK
jgi:S-formylglutathione hydrolase FrmB